MCSLPKKFTRNKRRPDIVFLSWESRVSRFPFALRPQPSPFYFGHSCSFESSPTPKRLWLLPCDPVGIGQPFFRVRCSPKPGPRVEHKQNPRAQPKSGLTTSLPKPHSSPTRPIRRSSRCPSSTGPGVGVLWDDGVGLGHGVACHGCWFGCLSLTGRVGVCVACACVAVRVW